MPTCTAPDCPRGTRTPTADLCNAHYFRRRRNGSLGDEPIRPPGPSTCSVDECDRPVEARGMCLLHDRRTQKGGSPDFVGVVPRGDANPAWKGQAVGYTSAHQRVYRAHGPARDHTCPCGQPARHWSYDHHDPSELRAPDGRPYSGDPSHYVARCVPCHKRLDLAQRKA